MWKIWSYHASKDVTSRVRRRRRSADARRPHVPRKLDDGRLPAAGALRDGRRGIDPRGRRPALRQHLAPERRGEAPGPRCAGWSSRGGSTRSPGASRPRESAAQFAALAYWANPATILNAEVLGYLDPLVMLPAIVALASASLAPAGRGGRGPRHRAHDQAAGDAARPGLPRSAGPLAARAAPRDARVRRRHRSRRAARSRSPAPCRTCRSPRAPGTAAATSCRATPPTCGGS